MVATPRLQAVEAKITHKGGLMPSKRVRHTPECKAKVVRSDQVTEGPE